MDGAHSKEVIEDEEEEGYSLSLVQIGEWLRKANYLITVRARVTWDTDRVLAIMRDVSKVGHGGEDEGNAGDGRGGAHDEPVEPGLSRGRGGKGGRRANQASCTRERAVRFTPTFHNLLLART